jgi:pilus assembly protein CpaF
MTNTGDMFNSGVNQLKYAGLLSKVQHYMSEHYASLLSERGSARKKEMEQSYIRQYISKHQFSVSGYTTDELVAALYNEMAEYSFLTPYLNGENNDWEEININRWDDVKISYCDGRIERSKEQFLSPQHATDVVKRLLRQSNITFDEARPCVRGHLNNKIRITVNGPGVIDDDVGVQASIRYINPKRLGKKAFIESGMATEEMLDFLSTVYRYGISICLAGPTGSGKTTVMGWILSTLPDWKRIYTIENTTREIDLTRRDGNGVVLNNVLHTVTRDSDDPKQCVTEQMLLEQGLTFNPDYICMAEMKGSEAFETQEAARTGHAVITTVHAKNCAEIYDRILDLCSLKGNLSGELLKVSIAKAFPITFIVRKMEDNVRRIVEICECIPNKDETYKLNTLYRFRTLQNAEKNGKTVVNGRFEKVAVISEKLQQELRDNGILENTLKKLIGDEKK